jgi:TRAP-type transport system periplasmic protein
MMKNARIGVILSAVAILVDLQRKGMQVIVPDADSFRQAARPAVEELFAKEWSVTTWADVLAQ